MVFVTFYFSRENEGRNRVMYKRDPYVVIAVLACTVFFGTLQNCLGQKGDPVRKDGEKVGKVEVPQKNKVVITQDDLDKYQKRLLLQAITDKTSNLPIDDKMSLYKKLVSINERIFTYQERIKDIMLTGEKDAYIKRNYKSLHEGSVLTLLKCAEAIKAELSKNKKVSREELELNLLENSEIIELAGGTKLECITSVKMLDIVAKRVKDPKVLNSVAKARDELFEIIAYCESACSQMLPYQKEFLKNEYGYGLGQRGIFLIDQTNEEVYRLGQSGRQKQK